MSELSAECMNQMTLPTLGFCNKLYHNALCEMPVGRVQKNLHSADRLKCIKGLEITYDSALLYP